MIVKEGEGLVRAIEDVRDIPVDLLSDLKVLAQLVLALESRDRVPVTPRVDTVRLGKLELACRRRSAIMGFDRVVRAVSALG